MATNNPAWLDAPYVEKILQNAEKDKSIAVSGITTRAATAVGDNYASDLHRVAVEFSRSEDGHVIQEKKSIIVKIVPQDEARGKMIADSGIFETELSMMSATLPQMNELLKDVYSTPLGARCLYIQYEKPVHIIFEDLAPLGFEMAVRHNGLDLDHCLLAFRNLGRFHAASVALKEKDSTALTKYAKWLFREDQPEAADYFNRSVKSLAGEAAKWPELNPRITEKLNKLSEVLFEKACEAALHREDDFNVLNHGDYWINNMMFSYDDQRKPIDHRFVDFQLSYNGSPAIDILYFFGTSPTNEVRFEHRELLLREYYTSLTSTMSKLKCHTKAPSFESLLEILKKRAFCQVMASLTILPFVSLEKGEEIKIEEMISKEKEYINPAFGGKSFRKIMTDLLPWYDSMGLLDV